MTVGGAVELSLAEARAIALRAQGFGRPRPRGGVAPRHVRDLLGTLGAVQLDAVNVLVRAHYLTVFSRLGPYRTTLLDEVVYRRRAAFEYWGHAASYLPVALHPAVRWRMAAHARNPRWLAFRARVERERPGYVAAVEREIAEAGPLAFGDLSDPARRPKGPTTYAESTLQWYRWSDGKTVLEGLFDAGRLAAADRVGFQRRYDLPERVIPPEVLALPTPEPDEAQRTLVRHAARALGVFTVRDIADYFRLPVASARARLRELADGGEVLPATVDGWSAPAYVSPGAAGGPVAARALLSPFDSLVWERDRTDRLFGFRHSFELYVKPQHRRYGYYVLPFLLGDGMVARVDLKADREARTLHVLGAYAEPAAPAATAGELAAALRDLAAWRELDRVEVADRGDLAPRLRRAMP